MKLYVLRARYGSYVTAASAPKPPPPDEIEKLKIEFAAGPSWLQLPYLIGKPGYPTVPEAHWMALYFYIRAAYTWGLVHSEAAAYTNAQLAALVAKIQMATVAGYVFFVVLAVVVVAAVLWWLATHIDKHVSLGCWPFRYLFVYQEKVWYADFIGKDANGRPYYVACPSPGIFRMTERRGVSYGGFRCDAWDFAGSWVQSYSGLFVYKEWRWDTAFVDYIGPCEHTGPTTYALKEPAVDPYSAPAPPGYVVPPAQRCSLWSQIP